MPVNVLLPPIDKSVPTYNFLAIAAPPDTVKDPPELDEVASVVFERVEVPETDKVPVNVLLPPIDRSVPTYNFLATAAPPDTVKHPPLVLDVASVVFEKVTAPVADKVLLKVVAPVTANVLLKVDAPVTANVLLKVAAPVTDKVPVNVLLPPIDRSVPTYNFWAIAAPPDTVKHPPAVLEVASVELDNVTAPVADKVLLSVVAPVTVKVLPNEVASVTDKVPVKELFPPIDKSVPTYNFLATAAPPSIVKHPPLVDDVASVY